MHDEVGHGLSVIVLQTMAALGQLDQLDTAGACGRLQAVEATARRSLAELRRVVGLLGEATAAPLPPAPGLPGLAALAAQVQAAGVPVDLRVDADPGSLPPDLGEAVYRIVQEALTNVIKHAGPCRATVTVTHTPEWLDVVIVADAGTGGEAVQLARTLSPDVVLMDIRMPGMDGLAATRAIMREPGPPRVIVLTIFDTDEFVYQAMKAGASGFLLKDVRRGQLADAIRTAVAGEAPGQLAGLTSRELQVLRLVGRGQPNSAIATTLFIAETTVKTHVAHILTKLGLADRAQAVVLAYETGLVQPGENNNLLS